MYYCCVVHVSPFLHINVLHEKSGNSPFSGRKSLDFYALTLPLRKPHKRWEVTLKMKLLSNALHWKKKLLFFSVDNGIKESRLFENLEKNDRSFVGFFQYDIHSTVKQLKRSPNRHHALIH